MTFDDLPTTAWKNWDSSPIPQIELESLSSGMSNLSEEDTYCRVCFDSKDSEENWLISACQCNGSIGTIHVNCLKDWLKQKLEYKWNDSCSIYKWKSVGCEICK